MAARAAPRMEENTIHIFSLASGALYERLQRVRCPPALSCALASTLLAHSACCVRACLLTACCATAFAACSRAPLGVVQVMMQSVMKNTHSKVKFWLLSNYASPWAAAQKQKHTHTVGARIRGLR